MKKTFLLCILLIGCLFASVAQVGTDIFKHNFNAVPAANPADDAKYKDEGLYYIYHSIIDDNFFDSDGQLQNLYLNHITVKLLNDEALDEFKVYEDIDLDEIYDLHARIIHPDGSMVYYTKDSILPKVTTKDNGKSDTTYNCTFSDLRAGDVFERYVTYISDFSSSGHFFFRHANSHKDYEYTMMFPGHLKLDLSLYNSNAKIIDTVLTKHGEEEDVSTRYIYIHLTDLPGYAGQSHASPLRYCPRLEYSIAFNLARSKNRITSTQGYLKDIYNYFHELDKNDVKAAKAISKNIKLTKDMSDEQKIRAIENYVKENYTCISFNNSAFRSIALLQQLHFGSSLAFTALYDQLFKVFKIDNQMVWTTDYDDRAFDKKFEGSNFYEEVFFYLPTVDKYLDPSSNVYHLGLTTPSYIGNTGAFLKEMTMGKASTYVSSYKTIPTLPATATFDTLLVNLSVNTANKTINGTESRTMGGYMAASFQYRMKDFELEDEESFIGHFLGFGNENVNVSGEKYENNKPSDIAVNPLKLSARFSTADLATYGSKQIEVTVGAFIGEQSECKDKGTRTVPVDIDWLHDSYRLITVTIPDGYSLSDQYKTLERAVYDTGNESTAQAAFIVKTEVKGNELLIHCYEYYKKLHYEPTEFEGIKNVWNASFEFNKAKVVFNKN